MKFACRFKGRDVALVFEASTIAFVARLADHALEKMGERNVSLSLSYSIEHSMFFLGEL